MFIELEYLIEVIKNGIFTPTSIVAINITEKYSDRSVCNFSRILIWVKFLSNTSSRTRGAISLFCHFYMIRRYGMNHVGQTFADLRLTLPFLPLLLPRKRNRGERIMHEDAFHRLYTLFRWWWFQHTCSFLQTPPKRTVVETREIISIRLFTLVVTNVTDKHDGRVRESRQFFFSLFLARASWKQQQLYHCLRKGANLQLGYLTPTNG